MEIFLIRHPLPAVPAGTCYGSTDLLAQPEALREAVERLAPLVPPNSPLFSSPLVRASALARALHPSPSFDARFAELNFGTWEMCKWDDLDRQEIDCWNADMLGYSPPGGERILDLKARVLAALGDVITCGTPMASIVSHAGPMRFMVGHLRRLGDYEAVALRFEYGELVKISVDEELIQR